MEFKTFETMLYRVEYPKNYREGDACPILFYLHGAGSRGDEEAFRENSFTESFAKDISDFPFVTVCPLCSANTWFDVFETLKRFVSHICRQPFADPKRVYLAGTSMGGYAAWQLAMSMPEMFAAVVPVCGGGMYWNAKRLKNMGVWAFHGAKDPVVLLQESENMVRAINATGGCAKLTVYPENRHNAWDDTFSNPEVYRWLLSFEVRGAPEFKDSYHGAEQYG